MNTIIEKCLKWVIISGIFALAFIPLFVAHSLFFPFITGKNFSFRLIVEAIGALWLALALVSTQYRPRRTWLLAAFAAFIVIMAIADLQGINPFKSFWSNYERMEGWVTLAHLFVLFVVTAAMLHTEKLWRAFWMTSIGVSILVGLYGVLQLAGVLAINQGGVRLDATFGNATYLAAYMMFHLFITAMLWAEIWNTGKNRMLWSWIAAPVMLLQVSILFFTATRGSILGVIGGAILSALILVLLARQSRTVWRVSVGIIVGLLVLVGGFFLVRHQAWVQNIEPLQRVASISLTDETTIARFYNWGMAWQGVKQRPLLGWGQENYNVVFNENYDPRMYGQEQWFDRVHDIFFDWLVAGGILGLLAYLSLFASGLYMVWKSGAFSVAERALMTGLFAAYFFHNLFVFDNITSYLLYIFVLAYIASRVARYKDLKPGITRQIIPISLLSVVAGVAVALALFTMYAVNWNAYQANKALLSAVSPQSSIGTNLNYFEASINYGSFGTQEAREQLVQGALTLAGNTQVPADQAKNLFDAAAKAMSDQVAAAPLDARFPFFLGALYGAYGDSADAEKYLRQAKALSPNKQSIRFQLGINLLSEGKNDEALALMKETYELDTDDTDALVFYAMAAIRAGQDTLADQLVAQLNALGLSGDQRIIGSYVARKQYSKIADVWSAYLVKNPTNTQAQFGLAAAYFANGDKAKAVAQLQHIADSNPDANAKAQALDLIKQINAGTLKLQ
jgi:O-antigen ligase/tetratricopeptide (TPR) repeat protein